jgi:hypothetical protein
MEDYGFNWGKVDKERSEAAQRAINVGNAGSALVQVYINRTVQQISLREMGAQAILPRKPGSGDKAYVNRRTPGTTGGTWVDDTTEPTEETGSYAQTNFTYRTLITRGKVTRKMLAIGRSYGDALAEELTGKAEDFADQFEYGVIQGNAASNANQINGLITLISAVAGQMVGQTSSAGADDLTLAKVDQAIDKVKGSAAREDLAIIGSHAGLRSLNAALQAQQAFNDMTEIAAGFRVRTYDGIPLILSTQVPDVLNWDGSAIIGYTGGTSTALIIVNTRYAWIEELTPQTVLPLAKTTSQYDQFDMFIDAALVLANTKGASMLCGVLPK